MARPAYQIPLSDADFCNLGKLTAIFGLIDDEMTTIVAHLLKVDREAANHILGSTKGSSNTEIWQQVIRNRTSDKEVDGFVRFTITEIQEVASIRNDFIHAVFQLPGTPIPGGIAFVPTGGAQIPGIGYVIGAPAVARRVRSGRTRSVDELPEAIERAARLSCLVAHISHIMAGNPAGTSPWLGKLPSIPSPSPGKGAAPSGKGRKRQP